MAATNCTLEVLHNASNEKCAGSGVDMMITVSSMVVGICMILLVFVFASEEEEEAPASSPLVQVTVHELSGRCCELELSRSTTIAVLKVNIENRWLYPNFCQILTHQEEALQDDVRIGNFCEGKTTLALSLVLSFEVVERMAHMSLHHCHNFRLRSVRFFRQLGVRAGAVGVNSLQNCMQADCQLHVRHSALQALVHLARSGSTDAIPALRQTLLHQGDEERTLAARVFLELLQQNNRVAAIELCKILRHDNFFERSRAVCALLRDVRKRDGHDIIEARRLFNCWTNGHPGNQGTEPTFFLLSMNNIHASEVLKEYRSRSAWIRKRYQTRGRRAYFKGRSRLKTIQASKESAHFPYYDNGFVII